ncbi:MAG: hypothetical protein R3244_00355 [Thermoanaerobaculia bacterium]|nr:hypothetical protein [Thermoanaerobaculia bacterium]
MRQKSSIILVALAVVAAPLLAQQTPPTTVATYDALADVILGVRSAELHLVADLLEGHRRAATSRKNNGDWAAAAAEIALFANEGDNAVAGVRKRLLEGGHHFNAEGEEQGIYEPGYVIVTREAKEKLLGVAAKIRRATNDDVRKKAWSEFEMLSAKLLDLD